MHEKIVTVYHYLTIFFDLNETKNKTKRSRLDLTEWPFFAVR